MGPEAVFIIIFFVIFGIFYLHYSTRNKERLALIEKGVDAKIFSRERTPTAPVWKVLILNLALLLMGIGVGIVIGGIIETYTEIGDYAIPGTIFTMAGLGLLIGFNQTKKLDKE